MIQLLVTFPTGAKQKIGVGYWDPHYSPIPNQFSAVIKYIAPRVRQNWA